MKKILFLFVVLLLFVFRPYFFDHKILFPSNLMVTVYAPWKYEPSDEFPRGPPNKPIGFDDIRQFFPDRKMLTESLSRGIIPLWNPYIYSGTPFMAAFDSAVWYPLSWIAAMLPVVEGWNFLVIIQPVLSLLFMFLFLRSMKFKHLIAAFGAVVWAFAGFMVVYWQEILVLEHSFLWLPLALYALNRKDRFGLFLLIFSLASSIFGGFVQMSIYVYAVVLAWNIFVIKSFRAYVAIGLSICIGAIQLAPSIEAYLLSPRGLVDGALTFQNSLLPIQHLITLLAPDYWGNPATYTYFGSPGFYFEKMIFIGVIPLVFAVYAMGERKNIRILFWTITAVVAFSMGFALPTSWLPNILHIPVLSNSYPTRVFGVWAFAATILSCYGLSSVLTKPDYKRLVYIVSGLTIVLAVGWAAVFWLRGLYATVSIRNLVLPTIFISTGWLLIAVRKRSVTMFLIMAAAATLASGLYFAQKYIYFSDRRFVYPELPVTREISSVAGLDRVWGFGDAYIEKNIPQYYGWFSTDGYGNLSPNRYAELLSTIMNHGKLGGNIRRSDTDIYQSSERDPITANPYRLRMMSLLGVKYILEDKVYDRFPPSLFDLIWQDNTWRLWQNKQALPRVIYATNYTVKKSPQDIIDALYDPRTDLAGTVVLERDPGVQLNKNSASHSARIISYNLNTVTIRTNSDSDGFIMLTDNYYPGWSAAVDGKSENIYRADYTFKAVFVPKGEHTVIFSYLPKSVIVGGALSVGGIISAILLL